MKTVIAWSVVAEGRGGEGAKIRMGAWARRRMGEWARERGEVYEMNGCRGKELRVEFPVPERIEKKGLRSATLRIVVFIFLVLIVQATVFPFQGSADAVVYGDRLVVMWLPVKGAVGYQVYINGKLAGEPIRNQFFAQTPEDPGSYSVTVKAVDWKGREGHSNPPVKVSILPSGPDYMFNYQRPYAIARLHLIDGSKQCVQFVEETLPVGQGSAVVDVPINNVLILERSREGKDEWILYTRDGGRQTVTLGVPTIALNSSLGRVDMPTGMISRIATFVQAVEIPFSFSNGVKALETDPSGMTYETIDGLLPPPVWLP